MRTVLYQNSGCCGYGVSILQDERQLFLWMHIKKYCKFGNANNAKLCFSHTGTYLCKCQQKDTMFRRNNNSLSFVNLKFSPEIPLPRRPWCHVIGH